MATPNDENPPKIDERYLLEWFEYGWEELNVSLGRHAAFDAYCERHKKEQDEADPS